MTQEDKDLLLKDLCARLPYNVKVHAKYTDLGETIELDGIVKMIDGDGVVGVEVINDFSSAWTYVQIDNVKPYLFPMSSMTEEQIKEVLSTKHKINLPSGKVIYLDSLNTFGFYNKNHIDANNLLSTGLANDATGLNIY